MKVERTKTQNDKNKKLSKFNITKVNDFIVDKNRKQFNHICDKCRNKFWCEKCKGAIILKCDDFREKDYNHKNKKYKKN